MFGVTSVCGFGVFKACAVTAAALESMRVLAQKGSTSTYLIVVSIFLPIISI